MIDVPPRPPVARLVRWLAARSTWELFGIALVWFTVWTVVAYFSLDAIVPSDRQENLSGVAGSMMGAVGGLFAFLTGFVISSEWSHHRDAQSAIGMEADSCVRLAWASAAPHCDGPAIRTDLAEYLRSVLADEWPRLVAGAGSAPITHDHMTVLQHRIRRIAADPDVAPTVAGDLTKAADAISVTRADRSNAASHDLPSPLILLSFVAGIVLTLTTVALALRLDSGDAVVVAGIVVVVALDLALLIAISAPFTGSVAVNSGPLSHVLTALENERYGPIA
ncbi:MAG TPA: hypothetical protein VMX12_07990 [Acidimicrobiia bacterium]|nr:hypothetical protein [Acidimicrobiia bacterium]